MSLDGGMLVRPKNSNDRTLYSTSIMDPYFTRVTEPVGTLAEYLGVEPVEPPEPDAEEVRRFLDIGWAKTTAEQDEVIWAAAAAWLRERERKQGGGA